MRKLLREETDQNSRSKGRDPRDSMANCRVTKDELKELEAAAAGQHMALSEWMREVALQQARRPNAELVLLTELTGIRLLLTQVLRPLALGHTLLPDEWVAVLSEIRSSKYLIARQVLEQHRGDGVPKE